MQIKNPRRGGNAAGAVELFDQPKDNTAPSLKFQPRNALRVDAAMKRDRAFFRQHPFLLEYTREIMPGEFSPSIVPVPTGCQFQGLVKVRRVSANVRKRIVLAAIVVPKCE